MDCHLQLPARAARNLLQPHDRSLNPNPESQLLNQVMVQSRAHFHGHYLFHCDAPSNWHITDLVSLLLTRIRQR